MVDPDDLTAADKAKAITNMDAHARAELLAAIQHSLDDTQSYQK
jgi:hypothetical protein